jgi:hypothetical protein
MSTNRFPNRFSYLSNILTFRAMMYSHDVVEVSPMRVYDMSSYANLKPLKPVQEAEKWTVWNVSSPS